MRRLTEWLLLLSLILACTACGSGTGEPADSGDGPGTAPVAGGTAVIGLISDVEAWNEILARQTSTLQVLRRIYLPLAREVRLHDGTSEFEPRLAKSWTHSEDGRAITFHLRETTWSDGTPITAEDVRFTWKAQTSPETAWANADVKKAIHDVTVEDDRTVTFHFDRVYPEAMADAVEGGILPKHVFGQVPWDQWRTYDWSKARVGSGPFLLERYEPGTEITLTRNPAFFRRDRPYLDRLVFRIIPDRGNLLLQMQAGAVDLVEGIPPSRADALRKTPQVQVFDLETSNYDYIGWNEARPPLDDPEIRRALTLAIDRQGIVEELLYGHGVVSAGPVPSAYPVPVERNRWPYDPDEANRILERKGFDLEDGVQVRNGAPFQIAMTTNAGNQVRKQVMARVQEQLGRIGVKVNLLPPMQMRAFVRKHMSGDFDAYVGGWAFSGKVEFHMLFGSDAFPPAGSNLVHYASAETDQALADLEAVHTFQEMAGPLHRLQERIHADQPYTFLYESWKLAGASARLHGLKFNVPSDGMAGLEDAWIAP